MHKPYAAIVDYGIGNLFSVKQACQQVGLAAAITSDKREILEADAVILPGVGAFGEAMATLARLDMVSPLRDLAQCKPFLGICLGMQLLLSESQEFGSHAGLDIVAGQVVRLQEAEECGLALKVPQVGWNCLQAPAGADGQPAADPWTGSLLDGLAPGVNMYFVHSFYAAPADPELFLCTTTYGPVRFCSGLSRGRLTALQFHPERSGPQGLSVYANLARMVQAAGQGE